MEITINLENKFKLKIMKAIIEKKIEYCPNRLSKETLSDDVSEFKTITTTVYFLGIKIYRVIKLLSTQITD